MSRLGDLENSIVNRLATATLGGSPVFATVHGASGGDRAALREALKRERPPAAHVAFVRELTAPATLVDRLGAQFVVIVAARMLRQQSNPRLGDATALGAFTLIDQVKSRLDDYEPDASTHPYNQDIAFVDADDRVAIYELTYRAAPIFEVVLPPDAPGNLTASLGDESGELTLNWNPPAVSQSAGPVDYYVIYRKDPGFDYFALCAAGPKTPCSKFLAAQPKEDTVQYCVAAANTGGEGSKSNSVAVVL